MNRPNLSTEFPDARHFVPCEKHRSSPRRLGSRSIPRRRRRDVPPKRLVFLLLSCVVSIGCERKPADVAAETSSAKLAPTNRVDINAAVRQNLGITFAKVEKRQVTRTLRIPGRFELIPTARREYRVPASGRIDARVEQFQHVEPGTPLYRLDSPRWRKLQEELNDASAQVQLATANVQSVGPLMQANNRLQATHQASVAMWRERVATLENLRSTGGGGITGSSFAEARASLVLAEAELARADAKQAELNAQSTQFQAQREAAGGRLTILLESAASLTGRTVAELIDAPDGEPSWRSISAIEIVALSPGVVQSIDAINGSFVDENDAVLTTVEPEKVYFEAHALQSDMGGFASGMPASVVLPQGSSYAAGSRVDGALVVAPTADSERRTVQLVLMPAAGEGQAAPTPWARAGVSAFLEVVLEGAGTPELAIPNSCVAQDGTNSIIFRRDPKNSDQAIRMEADLGQSDGRWVEIKSGVRDGDEIVLDGVFQLMVATSGSITKGGHFHPDGTFHEGNE